MHRIPTRPLAALPLLLAACAGGPDPSAQLGAAGEAIANAERAGALEYAPVPLQEARTKQAAAAQAARDDDGTRALRLAREAEVDAQLAAVRAQRELAERAEGSVRGSLGLSGGGGAVPPDTAAGGTLPATRGGAGWGAGWGSGGGY